MKHGITIGLLLVVVLFFLAFHVVPSRLMVFPKESLSLSNTIILQEDIDRLVKQYNESVDFVGQMELSNRPLSRKLIEYGVITEVDKPSDSEIQHQEFKAANTLNVGMNIVEAMRGKPDKLRYVYLLRNKKSGETEKFDSFPNNYQATYEYVETRTEVISEGTEPVLSDFAIIDFSSEFRDYTDEILESDSYVFMWISKDVSLAHTNQQRQLNALAKKVLEHSHQFIGLTATISEEEVRSFSTDISASYNIWYCDERALEQIVETNPELILIKEGLILAKWRNGEFPSFESVKLQYDL